MDRNTFTRLVSSKLKLVRTEQNLTQDKMAELLGISKKTLVQIEKERVQANWTTTVALCALFNHSQILHSVIGDNPVNFVQLVANKNSSRPKDKTLGGKVWWKIVEKKGNFVLQQNLISNHYRILDIDGYRWFSSFNEEEILLRLAELQREEN